MSGCHTPAPTGFGGGFALLIVLFILLIIIGASFYGGWGY
ncbi:YjcZ family sporulation protein [Amphibacillus jilinensis]|nr:YjcZ family sporulation protein [Amphibacillus jilinensis]